MSLEQFEGKKSLSHHIYLENVARGKELLAGLGRVRGLHCTSTAASWRQLSLISSRNMRITIHRKKPFLHLSSSIGAMAFKSHQTWWGLVLLMSLLYFSSCIGISISTAFHRDAFFPSLSFFVLSFQFFFLIYKFPPQVRYLSTPPFRPSLGFFFSFRGSSDWDHTTLLVSSFSFLSCLYY